MQYKDYLIKLVAVSITEEATVSDLISCMYAVTIGELLDAEATEEELKKILKLKGVKFCNQH